MMYQPCRHYVATSQKCMNPKSFSIDNKQLYVLNTLYDFDIFFTPNTLTMISYRMPYSFIFVFKNNCIFSFSI